MVDAELGAQVFVSHVVHAAACMSLTVLTPVSSCVAPRPSCDVPPNCKHFFSTNYLVDACNILHLDMRDHWWQLFVT